MEKRIVKTSEAPAAIGPYEQGIRVGNFLFISGQIAMEPATGQLVQGDIAQETERTLKNLDAILKADGLTRGHVVKTTVYLADLNDFARMNQVYEKFFTAPPPARACVQVAALPKGAKIEMDAIAIGES
ncbi:MAG: RidA family protein [Nitrospinaceae bacterium]